MMIGMGLFWVAVILGFTWLVRDWTDHRQRPPEETPLTILDRRFAEGLDGAVGRLTAVVRDARAADTAPFMQGPKDGR